MQKEYNPTGPLDRTLKKTFDDLRESAVGPEGVLVMAAATPGEPMPHIGLAGDPEGMLTMIAAAIIHIAEFTGNPVEYVIHDLLLEVREWAGDTESDGVLQ